VKRFLYLNKKDDTGRTALYSAAAGGHEAVVRLLPEKGPDVEAKVRTCAEESIVRQLVRFKYSKNILVRYAHQHKK
jgi:ankyrin repeat protein